MVFQAYIDDSCTPNGVYVLAGHVASAQVWAKFSQEWEELLPYGIRRKDGRFHFKMSEMAATPERQERIGAFYRLIEKHEIVSISSKINLTEFKSAMSRLWILGHQINWGHWSNPFILSFRVLIDHVHQFRERMSFLPSEKIGFIFDEQSEKGLIISMWNDYVQSQPPDIRGLFGATPRFEDDTDFLPLQAADLWAWSVREWYESGMLSGIVDGPCTMPGFLNSIEPRKAILISSQRMR
jgi:hypothetical protein